MENPSLLRLKPKKKSDLTELATRGRYSWQTVYSNQYQDLAQFEPAAFLAFHRFLERSFPALHQTLQRKVISDYSLLYKWTGSDPTLKPIAILAHMDVAPIEPGTEENWTHGAFEGVVTNNFVWGRGALDMKAVLLAAMEAVEDLVSRGYHPRRTVYLAFGHDEENGGYQGAREIATFLKAQGVQLSFTVDEGMMIAGRGVSPLDKPLAVIGVAEKGTVDIKLTVNGGGGHSSMPPAQTTVGVLCGAVQRLESHPMPASIDGPTAIFYAVDLRLLLQPTCR